MGKHNKKHHSEAEERQGKRVFMMIGVAAIAIAMLIFIIFS